MALLYCLRFRISTFGVGLGLACFLFLRSVNYSERTFGCKAVHLGTLLILLTICLGYVVGQSFYT